MDTQHNERQETVSDIVERLRDDQPGERQAKREARMELGGLLTEAADEIEKLRAALKECADALEAEIMNKYGDWVPKYPRERQKRDQDMEPVKKAYAALGEKE
jgi:predicted component of type VI protein secretion system